jgi:transposase
MLFEYGREFAERLLLTCGDNVGCGHYRAPFVGWVALGERVLCSLLAAPVAFLHDGLHHRRPGTFKILRAAAVLHPRLKAILLLPDELAYLPPYWPDLNPIELAFSKVKGILRRAEASTRTSLIEAIGWALSAVSAQEAREFFAHCGYRSMDQLL